jgi:hypothetical protein
MPQGRTESTLKGTTCRKRRDKEGFTDEQRLPKTDDVPVTSEFVVNAKNDPPAVGSKRANRGYNPKYHDSDVFEPSSSSKKQKLED